MDKRWTMLTKVPQRDLRFRNWYGACDNCGSTDEPLAWGEDESYAECGLCHHVCSHDVHDRCLLLALHLRNATTSTGA